MKKRILFLITITAVLVSSFALYNIRNFHEWMEDSDKVVGRVYKSELPKQTTNDEIAQILVEQMMSKHQFGDLNIYKWVWTYEIKEIKLENEFDDAVNVEIYVKPLFPDAWSNIWTFEVDRVKDGWVRVGYFMVIDDKDEYYELRGPFSGG